MPALNACRLKLGFFLSRHTERSGKQDTTILKLIALKAILFSYLAIINSNYATLCAVLLLGQLYSRGYTMTVAVKP